MLGIGIDILSIARFEGLITRRGAPALAKRLCTPSELVEFRKIPEDVRGKQVKFLSARWCLKEAAYKSLSTHIHPRWSSFALESQAGAPIMRMTENVKWRLGPSPGLGDVRDAHERISLLSSLSNDAGVVVGVVVATKLP